MTNSWNDQLIKWLVDTLLIITMTVYELVVDEIPIEKMTDEFNDHLSYWLMKNLLKNF